MAGKATQDLEPQPPPRAPANGAFMTSIAPPKQGRKFQAKQGGPCWTHFWVGFLGSFKWMEMVIANDFLCNDLLS